MHVYNGHAQEMLLPTDNHWSCALLTQGGASVVVYSNPLSVCLTFLFILFRIAWWPSAGKELPFWLSALVVLILTCLNCMCFFPIHCIGSGSIVGFSSGPRQANLVLIACASSEGSGEPAHPRSLARTSAVRSYRQ